MKITIQNFRGVKKAVLDLSRLALVAGPNASGKSSVAHAVAAALSGEVIPLDGLRKSDAGMLVHTGAAGARSAIVVKGIAGEITVEYPAAKMKTEGRPPTATPFAVGLKSLTDMDQKAAAGTLIEYLHAQPSQDDVTAEAKRLGLDFANQAKLAARILDLGWDGAHASAKETGIKLKGQWEAITGERFGSAKAESWMPKGWETGLDGASEETLSAELTQARDFLEAAIASSAITGADRDRLQAAASMLADLRAKHDAAKAAKWEADSEVNRLFLPLSTLPRPESEQQCCSCPHCGADVVVRGNVLEKPIVIDRAENERRTVAYDAAKTAHRLAAEKRNELETAMGRLADQVDAARKAADQLNALPESTGDAAQVEKAREGVQRAQTEWTPSRHGATRRSWPRQSRRTFRSRRCLPRTDCASRRCAKRSGRSTPSSPPCPSARNGGPWRSPTIWPSPTTASR
jgi:hypothetical protein